MNAPSSLEAAVRRELEQGGALQRAIEEPIRAPRRGRTAGALRLEQTSLVPAGACQPAVLTGTWTLAWPAHPVAGAARGPVEERGSFRCEVSVDAEGRLAPGAATWSSDLFEALLPWVNIPAGEFLMGSPESERDADISERPQHPVRVEAFAISATPVTVGQVAAVLDAQRAQPGGSRPDLPASRVTWRDALEFCNALSRLAGREPCYTIDAEQVEWRLEADGFRLPAEAEWEYACRAGTATRYWSGDRQRELEEAAWFHLNSGDHAHPVGRMKPNPWNLHDMHGNVWEWCYGEYHDSYEGAPTDGSPWVDGGDVRNRTCRGGAWNSLAPDCRSANRYAVDAYEPPHNIGFRVAMRVSKQ